MHYDLIKTIPEFEKEVIDPIINPKVINKLKKIIEELIESKNVPNHIKNDLKNDFEELSELFPTDIEKLYVNEKIDSNEVIKEIKTDNKGKYKWEPMITLCPIGTVHVDLESETNETNERETT